MKWMFSKLALSVAFFTDDYAAGEIRNLKADFSRRSNSRTWPFFAAHANILMMINNNGFCFFRGYYIPTSFLFFVFFSFTHCRNSNLDKTMWIRSIYYLFFLLGCKRRTVLCMNAHITWRVASVYSEFCFYKERQLSPRWWWTRATDWSAPTKLLENSFQNQVAFLWSPKNLKTL